MPHTQRAITDAAALKALAHPLRMDLLESLVLHGPRTATQLADLLGESPSNCSWHLRKLAQHGFVEEVSGTPGRNRPWRAASEGLVWGEGEEDAETSAAGDALTDLLLEREMNRLRASRKAEPHEPPEWRVASTLSQSQLWLTADEAKEIADRLRDLLLSHIERTHDPSLRPDGARLVSLVGWLAPRPLPAEPPQAPKHPADKEDPEAPTDPAEGETP
jgi:DNA-binding transcriptional ArsR family regulator